MKFQRLASAIAAAIVTGGGGLIALSATAAAPASAETACFYKVRNVSSGSYLNVRRGPALNANGRRYKVIDVLYPGQTTVGACRRATKNWRSVVGNAGRLGFSHKYYLNKGRKFQFEP
ncbi:hypothetical protein [Planobispora longispora]|uniref:SH3b domain-containing protein n=1 Tax=Planobispora longispora TaxID=28887 RepID=A0A8J3RM03_9ACTN|nr:hypothetical protein [Planobispora longispora]BFE83375.1 hypothetical protein GCM10020093_059760 [Planobispora longispora]GIH77430.1 hypothetical protein Plo01_38590 [Planobispora longispora]